MTVQELIDQLKECDPSCQVTVGDEIVTAVTEAQGQVFITITNPY